MLIVTYHFDVNIYFYINLTHYNPVFNLPRVQSIVVY